MHARVPWYCVRLYFMYTGAMQKFKSQWSVYYNIVYDTRTQVI